MFILFVVLSFLFSNLTFAKIYYVHTNGTANDANTCSSPNGSNISCPSSLSQMCGFNPSSSFSLQDVLNAAGGDREDSTIVICGEYSKPDYSYIYTVSVNDGKLTITGDPNSSLLSAFEVKSLIINSSSYDVEIRKLRSRQSSRTYTEVIIQNQVNKLTISDIEKMEIQVEEELGSTTPTSLEFVDIQGAIKNSIIRIEEEVNQALNINQVTATDSTLNFLGSYGFIKKININNSTFYGGILNIGICAEFNPGVFITESSFYYITGFRITTNESAPCINLGNPPYATISITNSVFQRSFLPQIYLMNYTGMAQADITFQQVEFDSSSTFTSMEIIARLRNQLNVTFDNVTIKRNPLSFLYVRTESNTTGSSSPKVNFVFKNSKVENNSGDYIIKLDLYSINNKVYFYKNIFSGNSVSRTISFFDRVSTGSTDFIFERNLLRLNKFNTGGQSLYLFIDDAKASSRTGCIYKLINNIFVEDYADIVSKESCSFYIVNNTFYASDLAQLLKINDSSGRVEIYNNTFKNNKQGAKDVSVSSKGSVYAYNNIFSCSTCFEFNDLGGAVLNKANNIVADPKFVNPRVYDFHLLPTSPAIDQGHNLPILALGINEDFDGGTRVLDGNRDGVNVVDIGAYEFIPSPTSTTNYTLNVNITGTCPLHGYVNSNPVGIDCGSDCTQDYAKDTVVELFASSPSSLCKFKGWSGDCQQCGTNPNCRITMTSNKTCTATVDQEYVVGLENILPQVNITANPTSGTSPLSVSLECSAIDPNGWITEIRWDFNNDGVIDRIEKPAFILAQAGGGFTSTTSYLYPTPGTYTATCIAVDSDGATNKASVNITVNNPTKYTVSVNKVGKGTVSGGSINCGTTCSAQVNPGDNLTLDATPDTGYSFDKWEGDCSSCGANTTCTLNNIQRDMLCIANFKSNATTTTNNPPNVSISANPTSGNSPLKVTLTCSATDPDGDSITMYEWDIDNDGVIDNISTTNNALTTTYYNTGSSAITYQAKCFATDSTGARGSSSTVSITVNPAPATPPPSYTLQVQIQGGITSGTYGTYVDSFDWQILCPDISCTGTYTSGDIASLIAWIDTTVAFNYYFDKWGGDCASCGTNPTCDIAMNANKSCIAYFKQDLQPVISSFSATPNPALVGNQVTFTCSATDPEGGTLEYWWDFDGDSFIDALTFTDTASYVYLQPGTYTASCYVVDRTFQFTFANLTVNVVSRLPNNEVPTFKERKLSDGTYIRIEGGVFETTQVNINVPTKCEIPPGVQVLGGWYRYVAKLDNGRTGVWVELQLTSVLPEGTKIAKCTREGLKYFPTDNYEITGNTIRFFIEDGGEFDYDGRKDGYVRDPFAVVVKEVQSGLQPQPEPRPEPQPEQPNTPPMAQPTSGGGDGGGCSTGGSVLLSLLILAIPLFRRLRG